jgi:hypothetical protein
MSPNPIMVKFPSKIGGAVKPPAQMQNNRLIACTGHCACGGHGFRNLIESPLGTAQRPGRAQKIVHLTLT